jgi:hypothetical protein
VTSEDFSGNQLDLLSASIDRASLKSTPYRANICVRHAVLEVFLAATPSAESESSSFAAASTSRTVTVPFQGLAILLRLSPRIPEPTPTLVTQT